MKHKKIKNIFIRLARNHRGLGNRFLKEDTHSVKKGVLDKNSTFGRKKLEEYEEYFTLQKEELLNALEHP